MCADSLQRHAGPDAPRAEQAWALLVLLDDERDARSVCGLLGASRDPGSAVAADILVPPVRGVAFFADQARQDDVDAWWSKCVSRSATPVFLLMDVAGLEEWLGGVDGEVYVGLSDVHRMHAYTDRFVPVRSRIHPILCDGPRELAAAVIRDLSPGGRPGAAIFDGAAARRIGAGFPGSAFREPASGGSQPSAPMWEASPTTRKTASPGDWLWGDSDLFAGSTSAQSRDESPAQDERAAAFTASSTPRSGVETLRRSGARAGRRVLQLLGRYAYRPRPDAEVARQLAARGSTVVVTGSRKGGVGKTSFAAGISVTAGGILDQIGHRACIVDANIANPDAWGELHLPRGAATVREVTNALLSSREPPSPVHATTPGLACFPEVREPTEYSRTAIRALADHLRRRYTVIVVDMSNRLPDPTAGPEAAVAAYWLEVADVLVLPTTSGRADFNGALDYLDVAELPPTLVPYIVPEDRRLRDNPTTLEYLREIRRRAHAVVDIPDEANLVRLAGMEGVPAEQLSGRLRLAYRLLTEAIADVPRRRR